METLTIILLNYQLHKDSKFDSTYKNKIYHSLKALKLENCYSRVQQQTFMILGTKAFISIRNCSMVYIKEMGAHVEY